MRYQDTSTGIAKKKNLIIPITGEDVEQQELPNVAAENPNVLPLGKTIWQFFT